MYTSDKFMDNFNYAGIELVAVAFNNSMPSFGPYILLFTTLTFAISTLFSLSFFGERCMAYLLEKKIKLFTDISI